MRQNRQAGAIFLLLRAARHEKHPGSTVAANRKKSAQPAGETASARELRHDLGNALGALRLRLQLVMADPKCQAAQGKNLEAVDRILLRCVDLFSALRAQSAKPAARSESPKRARPRK